MCEGTLQLPEKDTSRAEHEEGRHSRTPQHFQQGMAEEGSVGRGEMRGGEGEVEEEGEK